MSKGLEIDYETADRITMLTLTDQRNYLKKELQQFEEGGYLHPDDVAQNYLLIKYMDKIIKYFGGQSDED